jgi:hypothetical protein
LATDTETAAAISSHNTAANGHTTRGNTAGRPASPTVGDLYSNTETGTLEIYESTGWAAIVSPSIVTSVAATNSPSGRAYNNGSASIAFTAGTYAGTTYTATSSPGSYTASASSSPITITGLQSSTQYTYTVVASSKYGTSAASSASSGVTATTAPQAPTIGTATGADLSATLTFTAGATGGSSITNYKYSTDNSTYTAFSPAQTSSPLTISGLTNGTSYSFYLKAVNANGDSAASAASDSVLVGIPSSYESIQTVTVGSGGTSTITFSSIPATYTHLQLRMIGKTSSTDNGSGISLSINSSGLSYYHRITSFRGGGTYDSQAGAGSLIGYFPCTASGVDNMFGGMVLDILDYTNTNKNKTTRNFWAYTNNGVAGGSEFLGIHSGLWNNTSAITSLSLTAESSRTFSQYSHFALYGIKGS